MKYLISLLQFILFSRLRICQSYGDPGENAISRHNCLRHLAHKYNYEHVFPVNPMAFDNTLVKKENYSLIEFKMHLAIKSERDASIILSPDPYPTNKDLHFEIGVGTNDNQLTEICIRDGDYTNKAANQTPNILTSTSFRYFYFDINDDTLSFGKEGEAPLVTFSDSRLKLVKYFDMTTSDGNYAMFLYDCPKSVFLSKEELDFYEFLSNPSVNYSIVGL